MPSIVARLVSPGRARSGRRGPALRLVPGLALLVAASLAAQARPASGQGFDKAVLDRVKDATVYIKIKASGRIFSAGSGFVVNAANGTLLVMTNRHVAVPDEGDVPNGAKPEIFVVFRSSTQQEQEVPGRLVTFDHRPVNDLALVEVKGVKQPPTPIAADRTVAESDLYETMTAYTLGFPLGGLLVDGNLDSNPAVTVNAMNISSFRRGEANRLERIQYSGSAIQGNSGGPVVNEKGTLVGVVVERIAGENVGKAIPPNVIASFLAGDVDLVYGRLESSSAATAKLQIGGRMVDPFGKIKAMAVRYARQASLPAPLKPDAQGRYPILPGSTLVPMALVPPSAITSMPIADAAGFAEFNAPLASPDDRKLLFQIVLTDGFGRTFAGKPLPATLPDQPGPLKGIEEATRPQTLARWSCEANLAEGIKMTHKPGTTTVDLPGGVPINNSPQNNLFNAPCALVRVDGDFVAAVGVENTFDPGGEGVVLAGGKKFPFSFQSAGLLIWQDEKNFVRLERSKGSDGKISMLNRVLVEVYKNGKEAAIHYIDVPEQKVGLAAVRKGGSLQLFFALPPKQLSVFHEMAIDFNKEVFVGIAAANLSKRPFQAKLINFSLKDLGGAEIVAKPVKMSRLVDTGLVKLPDGTLVFEGAGLRASNSESIRVVPQTNMAEYKGEWSDDRQLLWNNDKTGRALSLELPVEATGKYEIKAKFTYAPDYAIAKFDIDGKALNKDEKIDFYAPEVRPSKLLSLGTLSLSKGKRKLTITIFGKNPKSSGFHFGLDEVHLVPAH